MRANGADTATADATADAPSTTARPHRTGTPHRRPHRSVRRHRARRSRPTPRGSADVAAAEALPIPDYDELSASQVVERLEGLDRESLDAIRRYESEHRGRNTILGKIAQLS